MSDLIERRHLVRCRLGPTREPARACGDAGPPPPVVSRAAPAAGNRSSNRAHSVGAQRTDAGFPRPLLVIATIAVTLLLPSPGIAQDVTAPALKAAYIYNFVKFTQWPVVAPASAPFVICVIGDPAV